MTPAPLAPPDQLYVDIAIALLWLLVVLYIFGPDLRRKP
jgi:hypothetical protein